MRFGWRAVDADDRAGGNFRHDLVVGAEAEELAAGDKRTVCGLQGLAEGVNHEARGIVALQQAKNLLRQALVDGRTIVMSTHQLREALELATEVALINRGRLAFRGERTQEMLDDPGWIYRNYGESA